MYIPVLTVPDTVDSCISMFLLVSLSVIRGSSIGPASFAVNAADLTPAKAGHLGLLANNAVDT